MLDNLTFLRGKLKEYENEELKPKPLVNGHDLMELGMKPGRAMKPVLEEAFVLQLEGRFKNKEDALEWLKSAIHKS